MNNFQVRGRYLKVNQSNSSREGAADYRSNKQKGFRVKILNLHESITWKDLKDLARKTVDKQVT